MNIALSILLLLPVVAAQFGDDVALRSLRQPRPNPNVAAPTPPTPIEVRQWYINRRPNRRPSTRRPSTRRPSTRRPTPYPTANYYEPTANYYELTPMPTPYPTTPAPTTAPPTPYPTTPAPTSAPPTTAKPTTGRTGGGYPARRPTTLRPSTAIPTTAAPTVPTTAAPVVLTLPLTKWRTYDGSDRSDGLGEAETPLLRLSPVSYTDGDGELRMGPNPRDISNAVMAQESTATNVGGLSDMVWAFGQFLDHDIGMCMHVCCARPILQLTLAILTFPYIYKYIYICSLLAQT
jgi:Animal haem peroxidase